MLWYSCIIVTALVIYTILLYGSTIYASLNKTNISSHNLRKLFYGLSFTAYSSGWIYLGALESTDKAPWTYLPLFLGPILVFIFFHRFFTKILVISHKENIPSIPIFLEKRYGNSKALAIIITFVCIIIFIPYIALQLRAIITLLSVTFEYDSDYSITAVNYIILAVTMCLAFLIILISGRQENLVQNKYKSLLFIASISAFLKAIAFISVAFFACYLLYKNLSSTNLSIDLYSMTKSIFFKEFNLAEAILQTMIAIMASICIIYLFQTNIAKEQKVKDFYTARWVFSLYLVIIALCSLPIMIVGHLMIKDIGDEYWLIVLPIYEKSNLLILLVLLGGFAATVGTTIVCCFSLSRIINHTFFSNYSLSLTNPPLFQLQTFRWLTIILILALAFACHLSLSYRTTLSDIGWISFAGIIQLFPAMLGALYWRLANKQGVIIGIILGISFWAATLFIPLLLKQDISQFSTNSILEWLAELLPFQLSYITFCTALAFLINFGTFFIFSLLSKKRVVEYWQATKFINQNSSNESSNTFVVTIEDLLLIAARFIGDKKALTLFEEFTKDQEIPLILTNKATPELIYYTEHLLAERLGSSTARAMVRSAIEGKEMQMEDVLLIADEASEVLRFNRSLLQGALEHIDQGISVVDKSLQLVFWNQRYLDLFDYPQDFISIGKPIGDIIHYNASRGMCGNDPIDEIVIKRLKWLSLGSAHKSERVFPNGRVIEIIGNPMPSGGFVTSFTDITAYRDAERKLQESNEHLEQRVDARTKELSELNSALIRAKSHAEQANESKTRFLAAVSHDLMQPLNAARLFASSLSQETLPPSANSLIDHLELSLSSAEELISDLLDMSRLESGRIVPNSETVSLAVLFDTINKEFSALIPEDISFKAHICNAFVKTDAKLLKRILQNFLTNAFRYGEGRVILGARRSKDHIRIEVWDQGQGIPEDKQKIIFEEFKRLDSHQTRAEKGLGLGLAIADGFCKLLNHPINVRSWLGKGSVFSVTVPISEPPSPSTNKNKDTPPPSISLSSTKAINILCVDNEESILIGMKTLLSRWQCNVMTAKNQKECDEILTNGFKPQILLIDYHLDAGYTGTELIKWLRNNLDNPNLPAIIISADNTPEIIEQLQQDNLDFIKKPVKPAQLRALISLHVNLK